MKKFGKIAVLLLAALLIFLFFKFELGQYLTLEAMKENRENFLAQYQKTLFLLLPSTQPSTSLQPLSLFLARLSSHSWAELSLVFSPGLLLSLLQAPLVPLSLSSPLALFSEIGFKKNLAPILRRSMMGLKKTGLFICSP